MLALLIVTVCYSITSCIDVLSPSFILSNSSTQTIPLSASTIAPASSLLSPVSGSEVTAAVSPTPVDPLPVVETESGEIYIIKRSNYDFAVEGSPTISMLISPLK